jgi:hypothetical protein
MVGVVYLHLRDKKAKHRLNLSSFSCRDLNENLNHSTDAVEAMHYLAKFFVSEARKSQHKFVDPNEEFAALIYNTPPTDTRNVMAVYTQVYFWK